MNSNYYIPSEGWAVKNEAILKKLFVHFFVDALRAMAFGESPFSIDMNALWAMAGISRREAISIERIRLMYYVVHRTLTTKSEREFLIMIPDF